MTERQPGAPGENAGVGPYASKENDVKALLIYPEFPDTFWGFKHALKFIRKKAAFPPLGLLTLAAMLPAKWSKRLVDVNVERLSDEDLEWADCVFISGMVVQRQSARQLIARCKAEGLKVVAGGPLFTEEHDQFEEKGCARRVYETEEFADVGKTPVPLWELADLKRYASMGIQFSRGCPFDCDFCNITALFGHRTRIKSVEQIIAELDTLYKLDWRGQIFFVDDNFIGNKRYLKNHLLPALIEWQKDKKGIPFNTEASVNLADDETLMEMMVKAGFDAVFIGIETPAEEGLIECSKIQNKDRDLVESVKRIHRAGLQVQGGFIVGFDSDKLSIFQRQIDFIQKSGIVTAMVGLLQAPVGTRLYNRLKLEGRLIAPLTGDNVDGTTNIIPMMGLEALSEGYRDLMCHIYSPKVYYQRVKTFLREYGGAKMEFPLDLQRVLAFVRSGIRLGIFGRERFQYWKILLWTLFRRPSLLPLTITLSIYGHHFRKICNLHIA
jgi:radical SAM superfamily enzyme YgiQ (UPF0313 family)